MCARCEELEEEIAYLKGELGITLDEGVKRHLGRAYKLTPKEALVLMTLGAAKGRVLGKFRILENIDSEDATAKLVSILVHNIRRKIAKGAVVNTWGLGYSIGDEGVKALSEAVKGGSND